MVPRSLLRCAAAPLASVLLLHAEARPEGETDAASSRGAAVRVDRLEGEALSARRVTALDAEKVVLETEAGSATVPLADVVEIGFATTADPPRAWTPMDVAADLWSGESLPGELRGGEGDRIEIDAPLVGRTPLAVERIACVRFLQRLAQEAEPPDLRPREDGDVVHLAGGDRFTGTVIGFGAKGVRVRPDKDAVDVPYERVVAVTLMADAAAAKRAAGTLRVALRDGTDLVVREPRLEGGRLRMTSVSGFAAEAALADVVALQPSSARFAFLSDLPVASTTVKPVWTVAAGDPAVLFAPRFDRSFSGRPLRCGGRSWLDGIGVYSGTTLTWNLDGKYREFRSAAGIDDGAGPLGGVMFQVLVDAKEAWSSGFVRPASAPGRGSASPLATPRIPLDGAKTLSLVVLAGDAEDPYPVQDEADWLGPIVVRAAAEPGGSPPGREGSAPDRPR